MRMPRNHDDDENWLQAIAEHPETTAADRAAAEVILLDSQLTRRFLH